MFVLTFRVLLRFFRIARIILLLRVISTWLVLSCMSVVIRMRDWRVSAVCRQVDPELMFSTVPSDVAKARSVCSGCPVQQECLDDALDFVRARGVALESIFGVWAGLTSGELLDLALQGGARRVRAWDTPSTP